jgi:hypothetical protein
MSSNANLILSGSIPAFEMFMTVWEKLAKHHPRLKPWIDVGLKWATIYYAQMDLTKAYIMTMGKQLSFQTFFALINMTSSQSMHLDELNLPALG